MLLRFFLVLMVASASNLTSCSKNGNRVSEQKLCVNLYCEPPSLDPRRFTDSSSANVLLMLFEGLTRIDSDNKPKPALAEKILISPDQRTYTFKLREAYWSNGDKVTAEDFAYSWRKILEPNYPALFAYKLYVIKNAIDIKEGRLPVEQLGVKVIDDKTLEVTLNYPTPYFLELVAFPTFFPVNKKNDLLKPDWAGEASSYYISNGPFRLKKWDHENEIELRKNPQYWDANSVKLQSIYLAMIDDTTTEFYMFEMGELDWAGSPISNLPPEFLPALIEEGKIQIMPATAVYYYKINTDAPCLSNTNIRLALGHCINRKAIVDHITQAGQRPALSLIPPMPGWEERNLFQDGDLDSAREHFKNGIQELGIEEGQFPSFSLCYNTNREHQKIAQAIQQQWKDGLGIKVDLETADWKVYLSKINKQDYQIGRMGWIGDFHDAVSFLEPFKYKDNPHLGGNNETGWENPSYTALLDRAEQEINPEKRIALLKQAEKILIEQMPVIPVFFINFAYLKKPYVHNVFVSPLGVADFKKAFLKE